MPSWHPQPRNQGMRFWGVAATLLHRKLFERQHPLEGIYHPRLISLTCSLFSLRPQFASLVVADTSKILTNQTTIWVGKSRRRLLNVSSFGFRHLVARNGLTEEPELVPSGCSNWPPWDQKRVPCVPDSSPVEPNLASWGDKTDTLQSGSSNFQPL
jgi:hypothetical protein